MIDSLKLTFTIQSIETVMIALPPLTYQSVIQDFMFVLVHFSYRRQLFILRG